MSLGLPRFTPPYFRTVITVVVLVSLACQPVPSPAPKRSVLIENAWILDGTGRTGFSGSLRFADDRILEIGALVAQPFDEVIDAGGMALAPGFIDSHSHMGFGLADEPDALAAVSQGITTAILGQDGASHFPIKKFFETWDDKPTAIHIASLAGHGNLREKALKGDFRRKSTPAEIDEMVRLLEIELSSGALGLSSGLEYDPGIYASPEEILPLAEVTAKAGGVYLTHIRSEDLTVFEAVEEAIMVGRKTGVPVKISHIKLGMHSLWGKADLLIDQLNRARAEGVDITADVYPYTFWQSSIEVLFPKRDYSDRDAAALVLEQLVAPDDLSFPFFAPDPTLAGKSLTEISALRGQDPVTTLLYLAREADKLPHGTDTDSEAPARVIANSMFEEDVVRLMQWPYSTYCTDGELRDSHPRGFGTMPRVLGRYVREKEIMSLPLAIHKMTGLTADQLGLLNRGRLVPGKIADLVLFDPARIIDQASTQFPHAVAKGVLGVWVSGQQVYGDGKTTGRLPGSVIRRAH